VVPELFKEINLEGSITPVERKNDGEHPDRGEDTPDLNITRREVLCQDAIMDETVLYDYISPDDAIPPHQGEPDGLHIEGRYGNRESRDQEMTADQDSMASNGHKVTDHGLSRIESWLRNEGIVSQRGDDTILYQPSLHNMSVDGLPVEDENTVIYEPYNANLDSYVDPEDPLYCEAPNDVLSEHVIDRANSDCCVEYGDALYDEGLNNVLYELVDPTTAELDIPSESIHELSELCEPESVENLNKNTNEQSMIETNDCIPEPTKIDNEWMIIRHRRSKRNICKPLRYQ
jgi:hypothetical protein